MHIQAQPFNTCFLTTVLKTEENNPPYIAVVQNQTEIDLLCSPYEKRVSESMGSRNRSWEIARGFLLLPVTEENHSTVN